VQPRPPGGGGGGEGAALHTTPLRVCECSVVNAVAARGEIGIVNPASAAEAPKVFTFDQSYGME
jgi:hypothetical protein